MSDAKIICGPNIAFLVKDLENTTSLDELIIIAAKRRSNDVYLIDALTNEKLTVREFLQKSHNLAAELQHLGCNKNTIVGIACENRLEYPIVLLGTILTGATLTCYNSASTVEELKPVFNITKPSIVFCSPETCSKLQQIVSPFNLIIVLDSKEASSSDQSSYRKFSHLVQSTKTYTNVKKNPDDVACILYSSCTTGLPKGVILTHRNFVYRLKILLLGMIFERNSGKVADVNVVPLSHTMGLHVLLFAIIKNETLLMMQKFDERLYLSTIQKYKVEQLSLVPTILQYFLKNPKLNEHDLSSVQSVSCGTAPLNYEMEQLFKDKFRLKHFQQVYGLTETTAACLMKSSQNSKAGTCGSPIPGVTVKVVDTRTGEILGKNKAGEICVIGPIVMKGYYGNERATADAFDEDGWLCTGDIGYYDADGDFFIVDRVKEIIKYKGFQVPPAELEALLLTLHAIIDCAVVGIPDEVAGELPRAYVVKRVGTKITEDEIIQYIAGKVSPEERLSGGVQFVDEIPRNAVGKIWRTKLRELWTAKYVDPNYENEI